MPIEESEENVTIQLEVRKMIPIAIVVAEAIQGLTGFEQAFVIAAASWSLYKEKAQDFLIAAHSLIPQIQEIAPKEP